LDSQAVGVAVMEVGEKSRSTNLEAIYDQHGVSLYRYALALTSSVDDAEDAVQEVFLRIVRQQDSLAKMRNVKAYLFTATRNAAFSILRRRRRSCELQESILSSVETDLAEHRSDLSAELAELRRAFAGLPVDQRETLVLKIYDGLTLKEIAKIVGASAGTVASRYRYGIAKLRQAMEDDNE
jgi:RNA polymerase sigma-70 factor, ECF subfamily